LHGKKIKIPPKKVGGLEIKKIEKYRSSTLDEGANE
jgi:hypothetical protein